MSRRAATVATLLVTGGILMTVFVRGFLFPASDAPFDGGPVVVLGDDPRRVEWALEALPGPSDQREFILSHPVEAAIDDLDAGCDVASVRCIRPVPVSTWGEAQEVAELAGAEGWPEVTVVTSRFHLSRSRLLFERCVDVPVAVVGPEDSGRVPLGLAVREAVASLISAVGYHDC